MHAHTHTHTQCSAVHTVALPVTQGSSWKTSDWLNWEENNYLYQHMTISNFWVYLHASVCMFGSYNSLNSFLRVLITLFNRSLPATISEYYDQIAIQAWRVCVLDWAPFSTGNLFFLFWKISRRLHKNPRSHFRVDIYLSPDWRKSSTLFKKKVPWLRWTHMLLCQAVPTTPVPTTLSQGFWNAWSQRRQEKAVNWIPTFALARYM